MANRTITIPRGLSKKGENIFEFGGHRIACGSFDYERDDKEGQYGFKRVWLWFIDFVRDDGEILMLNVPVAQKSFIIDEDDLGVAVRNAILDMAIADLTGIEGCQNIIWRLSEMKGERLNA